MECSRITASNPVRDLYSFCEPQLRAACTAADGQEGQKGILTSDIPYQFWLVAAGLALQIGKTK